MFNPQLISAIIGVIIAASILWLVRRQLLNTRDALRWIIMAFLIGVIGLFPNVIDWLGAALGIGYPPIIPLLIGFGIVLVKLLIADIQRTQMKLDMERLIQHVSILEQKLEQVADEKETSRVES